MKMKLWVQEFDWSVCNPSCSVLYFHFHRCFAWSAPCKNVSGHMGAAKALISLRISAVWSGPSLPANWMRRMIRMRILRMFEGTPCLMSYHLTFCSISDHYPKTRLQRSVSALGMQNVTQLDNNNNNNNYNNNEPRQNVSSRKMKKNSLRCPHNVRNEIIHWIIDYNSLINLSKSLLKMW